MEKEGFGAEGMNERREVKEHGKVGSEAEGWRREIKTGIAKVGDGREEACKRNKE